MEELYNYRKSSILYVDDEEKSLKYFTRAFENRFSLLCANNAAEAYRVLQQHRDEIGILMVDQRMPGEKGVQFLEKARQFHPKAIRILTTAYSDLDVAVEAVNSGAIYKYVTKPWDIPQLEVTLQRALEFYMVQQERDFLLKEKLSTLQKMMITDRVLTLGIVAGKLGHYVKNSLVAVRTFLDLIPEKLLEENIQAEQMRNPTFWKDFHGQAQAQLRRITALLTELLLVTEESHYTRLDELRLDETIGKTVEALQETLSQHGITVVNRIPSELPGICVEREKFQCLFDLLLKDEIISLPAGSHIVLSAHPSVESEQEVDIELKDDGPGLPQEALRSIFDPFFLRTGNYEEFGINLMACYFITYHHGGKIAVKNQPGQGVTFTLTFPLKPNVVSPGQDEEAFITKVLMNDAFWERVIAGPN